MSKTPYHHDPKVHNTQSAEIIVPLIMEKLRPGSVLDVGCGLGTWLHVFGKQGVARLLGLDGDFVDRAQLIQFLAPDQFVAQDLNQPFDLKQRFDLVLCLEVAEHLPAASAEHLVDSLCLHGEQILFSAAIPGQYGQNHLNEQWASHWVEKFRQRGYQAYDPFRPLIWQNDKVEYWYRQNMLLFSKKALDLPQPLYTDLVHPALWEVQNKIIESYNYQIYELKKYRDAQVKPKFYLKAFLKSILHNFRKRGDE